jgi:hypothetical protein
MDIIYETIMRWLNEQCVCKGFAKVIYRQRI